MEQSPQTRVEVNSVENLLNAANDVQDQVKKAGFDLAPCPSKFLESLNGFPSEKIEILAGAFATYADIIRPDAGTTLDTEVEGRLLRRALARLGYKPSPVVTGNLEDYLEREHLVEIYDDNGIQLYRNLEFFRYCSYSLLELALIDWTTLYERPSQINKLILDKIGQMFATGKPMGPNEVPVHILRERYLNAKKAFLINIKRLLPLEAISGPPRKGFISVMSAELIATGNDAVKIQYI